MKPLLLLIDDNKEFVSDFVLLLRRDYDCRYAYSSAEGLRLSREINPDAVLLDLMLNDGSNGLEVLTELRKADANLPVIIITDFASIETAVEAMKLGAYNYVSKTTDLPALKVLIEKSLQQRLLVFQKEALETEERKPYTAFIGASAVMEALKAKVALFANNESAVLIGGESGVGKELVARQIHLQSLRKTKPFVAVNCAAIPKELLESELFGHEKGAFTGADKRKMGKFDVASDGTIFFDEISELELNAQVKLLRVLQEKEFERVGGLRTIVTNARVVAATNRNLEEMVSQGLFRKDLYYRLNVLPIVVPPLRDRKEDIAALVEYFLRNAGQELKRKSITILPEALGYFMAHDWRGNVRELQNYVMRAAILVSENGIIDDTIARQVFVRTEKDETGTRAIPHSWHEMERLRRDAAEKAGIDIQRRYLVSVLKLFDGNVTRAARHCGISRIHFHRVMKQCGIENVAKVH